MLTVRVLGNGIANAAVPKPRTRTKFGIAKFDKVQTIRVLGDGVANAAVPKPRTRMFFHFPE